MGVAADAKNREATSCNSAGHGNHCKLLFLFQKSTKYSQHKCLNTTRMNTPTNAYLHNGCDLLSFRNAVGHKTRTFDWLQIWPQITGMGNTCEYFF